MKALSQVEYIRANRNMKPDAIDLIALIIWEVCGLAIAIILSTMAYKQQPWFAIPIVGIAVFLLSAFPIFYFRSLRFQTIQTGFNAVKNKALLTMFLQSKSMELLTTQEDEFIIVVLYDSRTISSKAKEKECTFVCAEKEIWMHIRPRRALTDILNVPKETRYFKQNIATFFRQNG